MDGHHRIKKVSEMNPECLCGELEILPRRVECPGAAGFCQEESGFVGSEEHPLQNNSFNRLVVDGKSMIPDKLCRDYPDRAVGIYTRDRRLIFDLFQLQHVLPISNFRYSAERWPRKLFYLNQPASPRELEMNPKREF